MANKGEKKEKTAVGEVLADLIQRNRRIIIITIAAAVVLVGGIIAAFSIRDAVRADAIGRVEAFSERYEVLRFDINEDAKAEEVAALTGELEEFAAKHGSYPGARSYAILANIHADRKNWGEAEKAWTLAAKAGAKTYLAPVALFNAAAAAEEQGNIPGAIALYGEAAGYADIFPSAPRAQFALGRLQEAQNNREAAIEAYRTLIDKWPAETVWTNLANSRIIALR
jgi:tetratricopeptide (TPR) repeat protein